MCKCLPLVPYNNVDNPLTMYYLKCILCYVEVRDKLKWGECVKCKYFECDKYGRNLLIFWLYCARKYFLMCVFKSLEKNVKKLYISS